MPSLSKLACLAVAAAAAFSTADAASLRTSTSKSLMSSLSAAHSKALKALTTKYDCDLGAADLVGTLKKVTSKSQEADEALTKACAEYQSGYEADLETKLGEADTLDNSAQGKGDAVYADAEKVANEAFGKIESEHGTLVGDAQKAAEDADAKQSAAMGNAEEKNKKKNDARALFELQTKNRNDDADAAKDVLRAARDGSIETAKGIKDGSIKAAGDTKKASDEKCKSAYDTRMSLVTGDEDVVKNKIKPLLEQLKACNSVSAGEDHSGGGSFLEVKAKTKCKKAAREKLRHLQSLLQVSLNIAETPAGETPAAETPAKEVTGNVASFESRLTQEKTFSENVLKACNDEAEGILNDATADAQDVYEKATKDANTLCSDEEAKVDKATEEHLTPLKKIAEDAEGPALAADAALKTASDELEQAQGRLKAAEDLQTSQMGEAAKVKKDALEEAEKAKQQTIQSTKDAADSIRKTAREDKEKKEKAKKEECEASHARLKEERELVAQIKAKISTLTTVRDDEIGEKDDCASKPCKNGGKCHDGVGSYTCECAHGWTGDDCETNVDDCASNPCKNGGTCHDGDGSYTCECAKGFSGDNCDIKMVTKTKVTCGGFNKYGSNKAYICQRGHLEMIGQGDGNCKQHCVDRGAACGAYSVRENDSGCKLFKVKNNGGNWNSGCETDSNWRGFYKRDCTTTEVQETDECHPEPCKNGGTCHDGDGSYTCECAHGWTGDNCETANGFAPTDSDQCIAGAKRRDVGVLYMRIKYQNKWRSGIAIRCGYKPGTWIKLDPKNYENIENGKTLIHFGMADIGWPDETSNPVHVKEGYGPDMSEWIQFTQEGDLRVFQSPVSPSDSDTGTSVSETFNIDGETYKRLNRVVDGWWGEHLFGVRFEPWKEKN